MKRFLRSGQTSLPESVYCSRERRPGLHRHQLRGHGGEVKSIVAAVLLLPVPAITASILPLCYLGSHSYDMKPFLVAHRSAFACRTTRHEQTNAVLDLPFDKLSKTCVVNRSIFPERTDQCRCEPLATIRSCRHSSILYTIRGFKKRFELYRI